MLGLCAIDKNIKDKLFKHQIDLTIMQPLSKEFNFNNLNNNHCLQEINKIKIIYLKKKLNLDNITNNSNENKTMDIEKKNVINIIAKAARNHDNTKKKITSQNYIALNNFEKNYQEEKKLFIQKDNNIMSILNDSFGSGKSLNSPINVNKIDTLTFFQNINKQMYKNKNNNFDNDTKLMNGNNILFSNKNEKHSVNKKNNHLSCSKNIKKTLKYNDDIVNKINNNYEFHEDDVLNNLADIKMTPDCTVISMVS